LLDQITHCDGDRIVLTSSHSGLFVLVAVGDFFRHWVFTLIFVFANVLVIVVYF